MNTAKISDMTRAIASPLNRSRMMPTVMTRLAPAKKPALVRAISNMVKLCAPAQAIEDRMNNIIAPPSTFLRPNWSDSTPNSKEPTPSPMK